MSFLTWPTAVVASAIFVPLLLLLYFLKLRRRVVHISSTLLWRKAIRDIEVNAPFRMLRINPLLLLQLLILLLLLLALARPVLNMKSRSADKLILVIDTTASMGAVDSLDGNTRLDKAKKEAKKIIKRFLRDSSGKVMIISISATTNIVSGYESSRSILNNVIDHLQQTDQPGDLTGIDELIMPELQVDEDQPSGNKPRIVLLSDGDVLPGSVGTGGIRLPAELFEYIKTGSLDKINNLGIVAMNARRDYDDPSVVRLYARVINAGISSTSVLLSWEMDVKILHTEELEIPGSTDENPGQASITYTLQNTSGGMVVLKLHTTKEDMLSADDIFALKLSAPAKPNILLVSPSGNADWRLKSALEACDIDTLKQISEEQYNNSKNQQQQYDIIVFDRITPESIPALPSISFAAGLPIEGLVLLQDNTRVNDGRILAWRRTHILMRYAGLDQVIVGKHSVIHLPDDAVELARGEDGPLIGLITYKEIPHIIIAFSVDQSTWPAHPGFAIFLQTSLEFLGMSDIKSGNEGFVNTADPISLKTDGNIRNIVVQGPLGFKMEVSDNKPRIALPPLPLAGIYNIKLQPGNTTKSVAVNLADQRESMLRVSNTVTVGGKYIKSGKGEDVTPREVWNWVILAALCILLLEWLRYVFRTRV